MTTMWWSAFEWSQSRNGSGIDNRFLFMEIPRFVLHEDKIVKN